MLERSMLPGGLNCNELQVASQWEKNSSQVIKWEPETIWCPIDDYCMVLQMIDQKKCNWNLHYSRK